MLSIHKTPLRILVLAVLLLGFLPVTAGGEKPGLKVDLPPVALRANLKLNSYLLLHALHRDSFVMTHLTGRFSAAQRYQALVRMYRGLSEKAPVRLSVAHGGGRLIVVARIMRKPGKPTVLLVLTNYDGRARKLVDVSSRAGRSRAYARLYYLRNGRPVIPRNAYSKARESRLLVRKDYLGLANLYILDEHEINDDQALVYARKQAAAKVDPAIRFLAVLTQGQFFLLKGSPEQATKYVPLAREILKKEGQSSPRLARVSQYLQLFQDEIDFVRRANRTPNLWRQ